MSEYLDKKKKGIVEKSRFYNNDNKVFKDKNNATTSETKQFYKDKHLFRGWDNRNKFNQATISDEKSLFYKDKNITLYQGSNLEILPTLPDNSVDSIVTDPPYELGFMGKSWDSSGIAYNVELWKECLRVLKPGGHMIAFSGSRTYHRMAVAIEDAGFEIRDQLLWLYGSGFPKGQNIAIGIDKKINGMKHQFKAFATATEYKADGAKYANPNENKNFKKHIPMSEQSKKWEGWNTNLKPAHEPMVLARKPLEKGLTIVENVMKYGTGAINIDGSRIGDDIMEYRKPTLGKTPTNITEGFDDKYEGQDHEGRYPANLIHDGSPEVQEIFPNAQEKNSKQYLYKENKYSKDNMFGSGDKPNAPSNYGDGGNASRYFYSAKAQTDDREQGLNEHEQIKMNTIQGRKEGSLGTEWVDEKTGKKAQNAYAGYAGVGGERKNIHTTVKPTDLMRHLVKLITPKGGTALDPFNGSGSTGKGLMVENILNDTKFKYIGIDITKEYLPISRDRIIKGAPIFAHNLQYGKPKKAKVEPNQISLFDL